MLGIQLLLTSVMPVAICRLALPRGSLIVSLAKKDSALLVASTLVIIALWLPAVLIGHSTIIAGERYWWLGDDAMISMRYARNLADGFGLVWNAGQRVEGYSNFLWTIYMVLVHLFPISVSKTSLVVLLTNIVLTIATIPIMIRLIRTLGGGTLVIVATLVAYALNEDVVIWTTGGFETSLLTFLLLLATYRVVREAQLNQPKLLTFILIAMMSLVRADAAVLSALLYAVSQVLNRNRKLVLMYSAISLILPIAHELFRISYYGDILPNTAYLKAFNWEGKYVAGLGYVLDFLKNYALIIGFAVVGVISSRQWSRYSLLGVFLLYAIYVGYVGGDAFSNSRFFVPVLPLLMILAFLGVQSLQPFSLAGRLWSLTKVLKFPSTATLLGLIIGGVVIVILSLGADLLGLGRQEGFGKKQLLGVILGLALALTVGSISCRLWLQHIRIWREVLLKAERQTKLPSVVFSVLCLVTTPLIIPGYTDLITPQSADIGNMRIGLFLKHGTPLTSRVADFWAGSVFYFSEGYAIDLLGKSDRYVAYLPVTSDGTKPGHNKFDFDYSLGILRPDFVVANFKLPVQEDQMLQAATGDWAFTGQLYFNPVFREHCLPNPVSADTWRTIFICDWSAQVHNKINWQPLSLSK